MKLGPNLAVGAGSNSDWFFVLMDTLLFSEWTRFRVLNGYAFVVGMETLLCSEWTRFRGQNGHAFVVQMDRLSWFVFSNGHPLVFVPDRVFTLLWSGVCLIELF